MLELFRRRRYQYSLLALIPLALALNFALAAGAKSGQNHIAATTSDADYLGTDVGGDLAPDFSLTDQRGNRIGLADFRGKPIALAFLDPDCTDVCPLTALQFRFAAQALGDRAPDAAFVAINVSTRAAAVGNMQSATEKWGNGEMANWYFLTGTPPEELRPVWAAYHVAAEAGPKPGKPNEQLHTPAVYLIDQQGRQRWYVSIPFELAAASTWAGPPLDRVIETRFRQLWQEEKK